MPTLPKGRGRAKAVDHNKSWGGDTSFYRGSEWRRLRGWWINQFPLCLHCEEEGKVVPADVVDHIKPIKQGGASLSADNIQSLCHSCHNKKTYAENNPQISE